jgi:NitT/TauT family transport system ATP-binding protein
MLQKDHLFEWRTILQNVLLGLEIQKAITRETKERADALLKTYGLYEFSHKYPNQLSGGMRQRAALIRTLMTDPEILLLDEAFSALDYQTRLAVAEDIYAIIQKENKTAILVTHNPREAILLADQLVLLAPRPTHVVAVVPIPIPQGERNASVVEEIYADLLKRHPANFATG